ncbi:hypothetical protein ACC691_36845, partial [Rhizobium johnstonii]|uniref:hypothetical protein n=1 Tax=Rhizobium johnstonii TaxID=3019933 RepID=UPI003F94BF4D
ILLVGVASDRAIRRRTPRITAERRRSAWIVGIVLATAGAIAAVAIIVSGPQPNRPVVALPYLAMALLTALCAGVFRRLAGEEAELTTQLAAYSADEREGRRAADALLTHAARAVHGRVQGECL